MRIVPVESHDIRSPYRMHPVSPVRYAYPQGPAWRRPETVGGGVER
jgi:hypothetical protein